MTQLKLTPKTLKLSTPIAVLGLGVSGVAVVNLLQKSGVTFAAWDTNEEVRNTMRSQGIPLCNFENQGFEKYKTLIAAAGIPHSTPLVQQAIAEGLTVASDIDLLYDASRPTQMIGVTGTNGKSTTTALIGHILNACGKDCAVGGNIGTAATALPHIPHESGIYAIELSSYQIYNIHHAVFDYSVLLNITPDHIDWHQGLENYIAAKKKLFSLTPFNKSQTAIIGIDTPASENMYNEFSKNGNTDIIPISCTKQVKGGIYIDENMLIDHTGLTPITITTMDNFPSLRGSHNHQNIMAAYAVTRACGCNADNIITAISKFKGLEHRQENVAQYKNILFINDSKATNFDATEKALKAYNNIHLILGGKPKDGGIDGIEHFKDKITHAYLIGDAAQNFANKLEQCNIPYTHCDIMRTAVEKAYHNAIQQSDSQSETVIMLSPACASFDQYISFEKRGEHFKSCVATLLSSSEQKNTGDKA